MPRTSTHASHEVCESAVGVFRPVWVRVDTLGADGTHVAARMSMPAAHRREVEVPRTPDPRPPSRVLVVEHDHTTRRAMVAGLRRDGHEVVDVPTGGELVDRVRRAARARAMPDLIVADLRGLGAAGIAALEQLRHDCPAPPVVLVTAYEGAHGAEQMKRIGVGAFVSHPVDLFELRSVVGTLLGQERRRESPRVR